MTFSVEGHALCDVVFAGVVPIKAFAGFQGVWSLA
jgi:hypothetical protein